MKYESGKQKYRREKQIKIKIEKAGNKADDKKVFRADSLSRSFEN